MSLAGEVLALLAMAACGRRHNPAGDDLHRPVIATHFVHDGEAVFFVGNSFFGWEGRRLSEWVAAVGRAAVPPIRIETGEDVVFGNTPLAGFLDHPKTREALASHKYSVFVLEGEEYEAVDHRAAFHQAVRDFHRAITAAGGRTLLFETWEFRWRRFLNQVDESYEEISHELGIPVIPAGLVFRDAGFLAPEGSSRFWLTASPEHPQGDLHPNAYGAAASAFVTFEMLTGRDPLGDQFIAPGNTSSPETLLLLSVLGWARARDRLAVVASN